jgi:hypothetical protein
VYGRLLGLASERGYPRLLNQTPYEHLPALEEAFPGLEAPIGLITNAYVAAHYGEVPETPADVDKVIGALDQVRESTQRSRRPGGGAAPSGETVS